MTGCPNDVLDLTILISGLWTSEEQIHDVRGGTRIGNRLGFIHKDMLPAEEVVPSIVKLFEYFKIDRQADESIGDFCARMGNDALLAYADS